MKREGAVSSLLHDLLVPGSRLSVSGPMGRFTFDGEKADEIVLIAGGVGITPLMSKIRYLASRNWEGRIDLIYSVKTPRDIIFRDELEALQRTFPALKVHLTDTAPDENWAAHMAGCRKSSFAHAVPDIAARTVHICGPTAMAARCSRCCINLASRSRGSRSRLSAARADAIAGARCGRL